MPHALAAAGEGKPLLRRLEELPAPTWMQAALAIAVLHGFYALWVGVLMAPDSLSYAYWSGRLVESGFDFRGLHAEADVGFPAALYALFATLLALLRLAVGEHWAGALVLLNFIAHVALGAVLVRLACRAAGALAGWFALILFLGCYDLLQWVNFVLSDATFVLLAFTTFTLAARRILGDARGWLKVAVPALAGIFYRPTGIVLLPDLLWSFYLSRRADLPPPRALVLAILALLVGGGVLAFAWLMQDPGRWPFQALSGAFRIVAQGYAEGEVISARFETYHAPPAALLDYVLISGDRFLHFFAPGAAGYGAAHWIVSAGFLLPCYALAIWLLASLWRKDSAFAAPERKLFAAAAGAVFAYASFHALVQIDFDWRYRTPIIPHLILLAAGGAADLARRAAARR